MHEFAVEGLGGIENLSQSSRCQEDILSVPQKNRRGNEQSKYAAIGGRERVAVTTGGGEQHRHILIASGSESAQFPTVVPPPLLPIASSILRRALKTIEKSSHEGLIGYDASVAGWRCRLYDLQAQDRLRVASGRNHHRGVSNRASHRAIVRSIFVDAAVPSLWSHLEALNDLAYAVGGGNRAFGLPGYEASVDYIWSHISDVNATRAWKQDFAAWFGQVESVEFRVGDEDFYIYGITYSPSTPVEGITAELVLGPEGAAGCDPASYNGLDVEGKIVLTQRFRCPTGGTLAGRVRPAAQAGAAGVIIYHDLTTTPTAGSLGEVNLEAYAPTGFIHLSDGEALRERLLAGETIEAYYQHIQTVEERVTQNVLVETEEGDPHNVIVVCSKSSSLNLTKSNRQ